MEPRLLIPFLMMISDTLSIPHGDGIDRVGSGGGGGNLVWFGLVSLFNGISAFMDYEPPYPPPAVA